MLSKKKKKKTNKPKYHFEIEFYIIFFALMFTNMEHNSHYNDQDRLHSGLRHDAILRGQTPTITNKINSQQPTKRLSSGKMPYCFATILSLKYVPYQLLHVDS